MPIQVQTPDGNIAEFPDGMSHEQIAGVLQKQYGAPQQQATKEPETSQALGFEQGVGNFLANAASPAIYAGEKLGIPMDWAKQGQQIIRNPPNPEGNKPGAIGRFATDVALTVPTMVANPLIGGALAGYQLRDNDSLEGAATSAALGAVGGKLGDKLVRGVSSAVSPTVNKYAKALLDEGVRLTPGQIRGGVLQNVEDKISSVPFVGDMINNARIRGLQDFNKATINRSLSPIGKSVPDGLEGREAIDFAHTAIGDEYNRIFNNSLLKVDPTYTQNIASLTNLAKNIPQYGNKPLKDFIATNVTPRMSQAGSMAGKEFKEVDSLLGQEIRSYGSSQNPNDRKLSAAYKQLQEELRAALGRANPGIRDPMKAADTGFANLVRIENAASRNGGPKGVDPGTFSPSQLAAAVKASDNSVRKNAVARGDALLQDLSDAGSNVLPSRVPDSGTPGRIMAAMLAGGAAGNAITPGGAVLIPAMAGVYTQPGIKAAEILLTKRPAGAKALADAIRKNSKIGSVPAAALAAQLGGSE